MTEHTVLRIGELRGGGTYLVRGGVVDDDGGVADRVIHLVVKQRRDRDRHRRKQDDEGGKWRKTSAPEGASHPHRIT